MLLKLMFRLFATLTFIAIVPILLAFFVIKGILVFATLMICLWAFIFIRNLLFGSGRRW